MKKIKLTFIIVISLLLFGCTKNDDKKKNSTTKNRTYTYTTKEKMHISTIEKKEYEKMVFGYYPQSLETNGEVINNLNLAAGDLPTSDNKKNWSKYKYIEGDNQNRNIWYIDLDTTNNGKYDYRGFYFTEYRIARDEFGGIRSNLSFQPSNGYSCGNVYWFKYEQIEWDIVEKKDGKAMLVANVILDSQWFNTGFWDEQEHNGGVSYSWDYKYSDIRKFLNEGFYNMAFDDSEKDLINCTLVDNSADSRPMPDNRYHFEDCEDNVFLLSFTEAYNYYVKTKNSLVKGSDYAKAQGLRVYDNGCSSWYLRSYNPSSYGGIILNMLYLGEIGVDDLIYIYIGVRPALWINL